MTDDEYYKEATTKPVIKMQDYSTGRLFRDK
jgi:hypothetical protein